MSGDPIFNQMRGRFPLLLYYVALSLCAPDKIQDTVDRSIFADVIFRESAPKSDFAKTIFAKSVREQL